MATQNNGATVEHPNADLVAGLRECADWLERHPELPRAEYAAVSFGYAIKQDARGRLTGLAAALGDRAKESRYRGNVSIEGRFAGVRVHADADVATLVDAPPFPEPEPILSRREAA